jgi:GLPGLI family protein
MKNIIFLLFFQILFSQKNIEVVYKTNFNGSFLSSENKKNDNLKNLNEGLEEKISTLEFQLLINDQKSLFKSIPEMEKDGETTGQKMAKIVVGYDNVYYTDLKVEKIIIEEPSLDTKNKVDLGFNTFKWEFLNETKEINGYKCYLAKTMFAHLTVFAWYCPQLPYSFGPMEFCNLPGLILELQKGNLIFQAEKIKFNSTINLDFDIKKIKTITKEERDILLKKQRESFKLKYNN